MAKFLVTLSFGNKEERTYEVEASSLITDGQLKRDTLKVAESIKEDEELLKEYGRNCYVSSYKRF